MNCPLCGKEESASKPYTIHDWNTAYAAMEAAGMYVDRSKEKPINVILHRCDNHGNRPHRWVEKVEPQPA